LHSHWQKKNIKVSLIETGNYSADNQDLKLSQPNFLDQEYRGAKLGRVFGLGGTSSKWGGQMIALSKSDFEGNQASFKYPWPIDDSDIVSYYKTVFKTLGLRDYDNEDKNICSTQKLISESLLDNIFNLRVSSWIPFKKRNFFKGFKSTLKNSKLIDVWLDCKLESLNDGSWHNRSIQNLTFVGKDNRKLIVSSKKFVITMGALESSRQILMLQKNLGSEDKITQSFCDHISVCVGELELGDKNKFYSYFSPFFKNGIMKSLRLELTNNAQSNLGVNSAFVHFVSEPKKGSVIYLIRSIARKIQGERIKFSLKDFSLIKSIKDLIIIAGWRLSKGKLLLSYGNRINVLIDLEQEPDMENTIDLSERNELNLSWKIRNKDKLSAIKIANNFEKNWNASDKLKKIGEIKLNSPHDIQTANYFDVYHPTCSLPFGKNESKSILDINLRAWKTSNLYVSSTAIFPRAGSANPGLTHLALTERLSDHLLGLLTANKK
jgi:hypothetical protein